jgi:hypothetical protein
MLNKVSSDTWVIGYQREITIGERPITLLEYPRGVMLILEYFCLKY